MNIDSKEQDVLIKTNKELITRIIDMTLNKKMYFILKRSMDIILSIIGLIILFPIFLIISIAIKIDSKGPVFFVHNRIGKNGKTFRMYKFRTMHIDANFTLDNKQKWKENFKLKDDPRITKIGKFLRKSSLDELPQILNILKGDLTIVGPRPVIQEELEKYGENKEKFLSVTPGLTGYWQTNGRSNVSYEKRMEMELYYIDNMCLKWDIKIFFKTILCVIKMDGAI